MARLKPVFGLVILLVSPAALAEAPSHLLISVRPAVFVAYEEAAVDCLVYPSARNTSLDIGIAGVDYQTEALDGDRARLHHIYNTDSIPCPLTPLHRAYCKLTTTTGVTLVTEDVPITGCGD